MTNQKNILKANKLGLDDRDGYIDWDCHVFQLAYEFGQQGINLSSQPVVSGWRLGKNTRGISYNHRDGHLEKGLSLMAIEGEKENATSAAFITGKKYNHQGILCPTKGSDGEYLILAFGVDQYEL